MVSSSPLVPTAHERITYQPAFLCLPDPQGFFADQGAHTSNKHILRVGTSGKTTDHLSWKEVGIEVFFALGNYPFSPNTTSVLWAFQVSQTVNLPAIQETRVQSLGQEDSLEKGMVTYLPGEFHGQKSLAGYNPWGLKELDTTEQLTLSFSLFYVKNEKMGWERTFELVEGRRGILESPSQRESPRQAPLFH